MEIKSTKPVSMSDAKDILAKRKEDSELGYEQSQALENTERFATIESDKARKIMDELRDNKKITEEMAAKIVDIRPSNAATLRAILVKDRVEMSDEEVEKILKELS